MYILYGIPNCDSVKKARVWLDQNKISYEFHDYKKSGITKSHIKSWCQQIGWEQVMNKNSTTWKELDELTQKTVVNMATAIDIMHEHNSIIKRPIIEQNGKIVAIRFNAEAYQKAFL